MNKYLVITEENNSFQNKDTTKFRAIFDLRLSEENDYPNCDIPIFKDATLLWPGKILKQNNNIKGVMALNFRLPTMKFEAYMREAKYQDILNDFCQNYYNNQAPAPEAHYLTSIPPIGFHTPRTIAMIVNEAFFALEENLATKEDIDAAVKFGVNYPHGPFEWLHLLGGIPKGVKIIVGILDILFHTTHDPRYKVALSLRELTH